MKRELSREHRSDLLDILAIRHTHSDMGQWAGCKECQDKFLAYKHAKAKLSAIEREELEKRVSERARQILGKLHNIA